MDNIQVYTHHAAMWSWPDISIDVFQGEHELYPSTWGAGRTFADPFARLYYVAGGNGQITHRERVYHLRKGGLYLIPTAATARYECCPHLDLYWIHFTAQVFGVVSLFSLVEPAFEMDVKELPYAKDLFEVLVNGWRSEDAAAVLEVDGIVRQLLGRFYAQRSEVVGGDRMSGLVRMRPVLDYIDAQLGRVITLGELAEIMHLHPHYFSNLFKEIMHVPPLTYVVQRRVEKAQHLLALTVESVKTIAWTVGYDDEFYFSRVFKKVVGLSPAAYRKHQLEREKVLE